MNVKDIMNPSVVSIDPGESASAAAVLLKRHNIGSLPVCSKDGHLQGIVTDRDIILRCVASHRPPDRTPVSSIMSTGVTCISPGADIGEASSLMAEKQVRRLPVAENGQLVGIIALGDMAQDGNYDMEAAEALSEISANVKKK